MQNDENVRSVQQSEAATFGRLGRRVEIKVNAKVSVNQPGYSIKFFTETAEVLLGIGKDHVARLVMDKEAWEALKAGEEIGVTTLKQFKKQFL